MLPKLKAVPKPRGLRKDWTEQGTRTVSGKPKDGFLPGLVGGRQDCRPHLPSPKLSLLLRGQKPRGRCGKVGNSLHLIYCRLRFI